MRYVCGAQKEDISGYAMLHKVRRDRCSLVIYHTRISLSATFRAFTKLLWAAFINWGAVDHETRFELLWRALSSLSFSLLLSARLCTLVQNGLNPPKIISPELISRIFSSKFHQIDMISVSVHCLCLILKMCQIVADINQFHNFFSLIVGGFLQIGPTVFCELLQTLPRPTKDILMT